MAQWRKTFYNLGPGVEYIPDPRVQEQTERENLRLAAAKLENDRLAQERRLAIDEARLRMDQALSPQEYALRAELGRGQLAQGGERLALDRELGMRGLEDQTADRALRAELGRGGLEVQRAGLVANTAESEAKLRLAGRAQDFAEREAGLERADRGLDRTSREKEALLRSRTALKEQLLRNQGQIDAAGVEYEGRKAERAAEREAASQLERDRLARDSENNTNLGASRLESVLQGFPTGEEADESPGETARKIGDEATTTYLGGYDGGRPPQTVEEAEQTFAALNEGLDRYYNRVVDMERRRLKDETFEVNDLARLEARRNSAKRRLAEVHGQYKKRLEESPLRVNVPNEGSGRAKPQASGSVGGSTSAGARPAADRAQERESFDTWGADVFERTSPGGVPPIGPSPPPDGGMPIAPPAAPAPVPQDPGLLRLEEVRKRLLPPEARGEAPPEVGPAERALIRHLTGQGQDGIKGAGGPSPRGQAKADMATLRILEELNAEGRLLGRPSVQRRGPRQRPLRGSGTIRMPGEERKVPRANVRRAD